MQFKSENYINETSLVQRNFMTKVYGWMTLGLSITAITSFFVSTSPVLLKAILGNSILFFALFILEIFMVGYLAMRIKTMSFNAAMNLFLAYSLVNGLTLSFIFIAYAKASIASAFFTTAGMFGAMSIFGLITKKDLTNFGGFLIMGLFGIIIASIINIFMKSGTFVLVISILGVLIFTGLTAYDTQKIKNYAFFGDSEMGKKMSILGALTLYLDFINLFLYLLRFFGRRND